MPNTNLGGKVVSDLSDVNDVAKCQSECQRDLRCSGFVYRQSDKKCWLKKDTGSMSFDQKGLVSGYPGCKYILEF